jgi:hypothetical protein
MSATEGVLVELKRKVLRRFYEPLLLLNALGQVRGSRIKPELDSATSEPNHQKIRRSFADGIAYICAYNIGPDFVTAAALESSPEGVIVWLAANAAVKPKVFTFLKGVLDDLSYVAIQRDASERYRAGLRIQEALVAKVVAFSEARLRVYYKRARTFIRACLTTLGDSDQLISKSIKTASSDFTKATDEVGQTQLM